MKRYLLLLTLSGCAAFPVCPEVTIKVCPVVTSAKVSP